MIKSYRTWLDGDPQRVACVRNSVSTGDISVLSEEPYFSFFLEYSLVDPGYMLEVLQSLTYGSLTRVEDLEWLGHEGVANSTVDGFSSNRGRLHSHLQLWREAP